MVESTSFCAWTVHQGGVLSVVLGALGGRLTASGAEKLEPERGDVVSLGGCLGGKGSHCSYLRRLFILFDVWR